MPYCSINDLLTFMNITENDIEFTRVKQNIERAQDIVLNDLTHNVINSIITDIDTSEHQYRLSHKWIADTNFDKVIDENDITVYYWEDITDETSKHECTVSSITDNTGWIVLDSGTPTTHTITADYRYYNNFTDFTMLSLATLFLTSYLIGVGEFSLLPERTTLGPARFGHNHPYMKLYEQYTQLKFDLMHQPMTIIKYKYKTKIDRLGWSMS